jgi:hypothetical protein
MGYRSEVGLVAIVPDAKMANECVKAYLVKAKLEGTLPPDADRMFGVKSKGGLGYIYDKFHDVKWNESYKDIRFIMELYRQWVPEFFELKELPYSTSFVRIGEELGDIEEDSQHSDCEAYYELAWDVLQVYTTMEMNL